jgi:CBS domain-containing protein
MCVDRTQQLGALATTFASAQRRAERLLENAHKLTHAGKPLNAKLVSSIEATYKLRLATASTDTILRDIAKLLSKEQISLVVVCSAHGAMAGVITKTNLVQHIAQPSTISANSRAKDAMNTEVVACKPDDDLSSVLAMMKARHLVHIPVLDDKGVPLGVINAHDALNAMLKDEKYEEALLRDYVLGIGYQ